MWVDLRERDIRYTHTLRWLYKIPISLYIADHYKTSAQSNSTITKLQSGWTTHCHPYIHSTTVLCDCVAVTTSNNR